MSSSDMGHAGATTFAARTQAMDSHHQHAHHAMMEATKAETLIDREGQQGGEMAKQPPELELLVLCQTALNDAVVEQSRSLIAKAAEDPQRRTEAIATIAHTFNDVYDTACAQLAAKFAKHCDASRTHYEPLGMPMHPDALLFRDNAWPLRVKNVEMFAQAVGVDPTELLQVS